MTTTSPPVIPTTLPTYKTTKPLQAHQAALRSNTSSISKLASTNNLKKETTPTETTRESTDSVLPQLRATTTDSLTKGSPSQLTVTTLEEIHTAGSTTAASEGKIESSATPAEYGSNLAATQQTTEGTTKVTTVEEVDVPITELSTVRDATEGGDLTTSSVRETTEAATTVEVVSTTEPPTVREATKGTDPTTINKQEATEVVGGTTEGSDPTTISEQEATESATTVDDVSTTKRPSVGGTTEGTDPTTSSGQETTAAATTVEVVPTTERTQVVEATGAKTYLPDSHPTSKGTDTASATTSRSEFGPEETTPTPTVDATTTGQPVVTDSADPTTYSVDSTTVREGTVTATVRSRESQETTPTVDATTTGQPVVTETAGLTTHPVDTTATEGVDTVITTTSSRESEETTSAVDASSLPKDVATSEISEKIDTTASSTTELPTEDTSPKSTAATTKVTPEETDSTQSRSTELPTQDPFLTSTTATSKITLEETDTVPSSSTELPTQSTSKATSTASRTETTAISEEEVTTTPKIFLSSTESTTGDDLLVTGSSTRVAVNTAVPPPDTERIPSSGSFTTSKVSISSLAPRITTPDEDGVTTKPETTRGTISVVESSTPVTETTVPDTPLVQGTTGTASEVSTGSAVEKPTTGRGESSSVSSTDGEGLLTTTTTASLGSVSSSPPITSPSSQAPLSISTRSPETSPPSSTVSKTTSAPPLTLEEIDPTEEVVIARIEGESDNSTTSSSSDHEQSTSPSVARTSVSGTEASTVKPDVVYTASSTSEVRSYYLLCFLVRFRFLPYTLNVNQLKGLCNAFLSNTEH